MAEPREEAELRAQLERLVERELHARVRAVLPLPGQLGLRRFLRLHLTGEPASAVARVEAPEDPAGRPAGALPEPPLEPVRALFAAAGLPVPARLAADEAGGLELLEDLGDRSLATAAPFLSPAERASLYDEACALVPRIQALRDPGGVLAFRRRLDPPLLRYKAELFADWSLSSRGPAATAAERAAVGDAFARVGAAVASAPARLAHRDLQSSNLMLPPGRPPGARLVLIDLQGAFLAPPEYDLVCLLRDSYVELEAAELERLLDAVRPRLPDAPDAETFAARFDLLTLARKGKDHARFVYAARVRGDRRFLRYLPATLRYLRAAASRAAARDPALAPLAELVASLPEMPCAE
jgi:aminoglycoside/choline kinase family phosphotransferase